MGQTFSEIIRGDQLTLVDFYAEWCGPCKLMKPILEDLKQRIGDKARILKVDIDQSPLVASAYHIQAVPTLMLFRNGQVLWRHSGVLPAAKLEQVIGQFIFKTEQASVDPAP
ncbi:MAG: thioredoxin [Chitinophagales bacterium]|nr:thioredoxin [Chitinophagales bacterium]MDW8427978.1 thioredoxin [Chitinophagales bacterium]